MDELHKRAIEIITADGLDGEVECLHVNNPQAIVLKFPKIMTQAQQESIHDQWKNIFVGTPLEHVPVVVLMGGADIAVVDMKEETDGVKGKCNFCDKASTGGFMAHGGCSSFCERHQRAAAYSLMMQLGEMTIEDVKRFEEKAGEWK